MAGPEVDGVVRFVGSWFGLRRFGTEQITDAVDILGAGGIGEEAVVPETVEATRQDMDQEPADELTGGKAHDLLSVGTLAAIVLVAELHRIGVSCDHAAVRDCNPVSVAREIGKHRLGTAERSFGIDNPLAPAEGGEILGEGFRFAQRLQFAEEAQLAGLVQRCQPV